MKKKHIDIMKVNKRRVQVKNGQWITTVELTVNTKKFFQEKQAYYHRRGGKHGK